MKDPKNWMLENRTYIFGGGVVYQPVCNKSREKILEGYVKKPAEFDMDGKCFNRHVGHVTANECTKHLKKDVAFVNVGEDIIRTGFGSGAMLGGLDKELTYHPITKSKCERAQKLDKKRSKLTFWTENDPIPSRCGITASEKKKLVECKKVARDEKKFGSAVASCFKKDIGRKKLSETGMSALIKHPCKPKGFEKSDNIDKLVEKDFTTPDTVRRELELFGKKVKDIAEVYHAPLKVSVPFSIKMKDETWFVIAPQIPETSKQDECSELGRTIRRKIRKKEEELDSKIRWML